MILHEYIEVKDVTLEACELAEEEAQKGIYETTEEAFLEKGFIHKGDLT